MLVKKDMSWPFNGVPTNFSQSYFMMMEKVAKLGLTYDKFVILMAIQSGYKTTKQIYPLLKNVTGTRNNLHWLIKARLITVNKDYQLHTHAISDLGSKVIQEVEQAFKEQVSLF